MKKEKKFNLKKFFIGLLIFLLILAGVFFAGIKFANNKENTKITSTQLYGQLNEISELSVMEYKYSKVGQFENSLSLNGWTIPLTKKEFLLTYSGEIKAGIKMEDIEIEIEDHKIIVLLPEVEILSNTIDEESIELYDETNNIFNPIKISDYTTFAKKQKEYVEDEAIENGLLSEASTKCAKVVKNILLMIPEVSENYEIEITYK